MESRCVLVVEDEPMVRTMLEVALKRWGFNTVSSKDESEAQEQLKSGLRPCLILMNLNLARMKAHAFREWQRQHPELRQTPVIVLSGGGLPEQMRDELQAAGYLSKPINFPALRALLAEHCPSELRTGEPSPNPRRNWGGLPRVLITGR